MGEDIALGQRVEAVTVVGHLGDQEYQLARCQAVGRLRILRCEATEVDGVTIRIDAFRDTPHFSTAAMIGAAGPSADAEAS